jgi:uncharacterized protein
MSVKKPSETEEEYFAREEAVRRHTMAVEKARQLEQQHLAELKTLHWMKCPKCGFDLEPVKFHDVVIDKCFHCNGTFLDAGELEQLAGHESSLLQRIVSVFKRG